MARPVGQKTRWLRFVERRRRELHDDYPCAAPTRQRFCPRHRIPVPQSVRVPETSVTRPDGTRRYVARQTIRLSGICKPCRDELLSSSKPNIDTRRMP